MDTELHSLIESVPEAVVLVDDAGVIARVNKLAMELFEGTQDALEGKPISALVPPRFAKAHVRHERSYLHSPDMRLMSQRSGLRACRIDGTEFPCEVGLSPLDHVGRRYVMALVRDVSERERALDALNQSEMLLRNVVTSAPVVLFSFDGDGVVTFCEGLALGALGLSASQAMGQPAAHLLGNGPEAVDAVRRALAGEEVFWTGAVGRAAFEARLTPYRSAGRGESGATGVLIDVTERASAERALRESEERYRWLFESSPLAILVWDVDTLGVLAVNQEAVRCYGFSREEFAGLTLLDLQPVQERDDARKRIFEAARAQEERSGVTSHRRKDGRIVEMEIRSVPVTYAGRSARQSAVRDVTKERLREAELRQSQKMEAVGRLAGGVAHDFNNMLSVVLSYSGMLLKSRQLDGPTREDLIEIERAAERAAALTRQLLAFSRQQVREPRVIDLNESVDSMQKMLRRLMVEHVVLETRLNGRPCPVFADPSQMEQLILNLAVNGRDAMPEGGRLLIETDSVELGSDELRHLNELEPGRYVRLRVSDTGVGMDEATLAHIFEPFFSTKEQSHGTGLGLATVYGVVHQSGGAIMVTSKRGVGSTFEVLLPRAAEAQRPSRASPSSEKARSGQERILLVEDEPAVRRAARAILKRRGYEVLEARDGAEAIAMARNLAEPIDLLLTDLVMPGMNGRDLARQLAEVRPGMLVLFMSGYAADEALRDDVLGSRIAFLQKPFTPDTLAARVRSVLDAGCPGEP